MTGRVGFTTRHLTPISGIGGSVLVHLAADVLHEGVRDDDQQGDDEKLEHIVLLWLVSL